MEPWKLERLLVVWSFAGRNGYKEACRHLQLEPTGANLAYVRHTIQKAVRVMGQQMLGRKIVTAADYRAVQELIVKEHQSTQELT